MLALYEFWTRLYENYFVRVRVLENSVRRFKNYLVIVRVFENCSVLVCVFKNIVRLYKNNMESGSSYMKSLWNPVRLLKLGPVFLKIFEKSYVFLKKSRVVRWYCTSVYCIVRFIPIQQISLTVKDSISDSPTTATTTTPDSLQSTLLPNNIQ